MRLALGLLISVLSSTGAFADDVIPGHRVDSTIDGPIIIGAIAGVVAPIAIPVRQRGLWNTQLFGEVDRDVFTKFSPRAARLADVTVGLAVAAPVVYLMGNSTDDADGDRLMIYAETMAIELALMQVTKYLVQRPRPYAYNPSPAARAYTRAAGDDAHLSFYSGHAAMSFGAAVSGAYLLGASEAHPNVRMLAWGMGMATAATTANLRVRAGKHFYSDVVIGAAIGIAVGYVVPALHATDTPYSPTAGELAMGGVGLLVGMLGSELIPLGSPAEEAPRGGSRRGSLGRLGIDRVGLAPMTLPNGAGLALAGSL